MSHMHRRILTSLLLLGLAGCASESDVIRTEISHTLHSHLSPKVLALCIDGNASKSTLFGTVQSRIINTGENTLEVIVGSGNTVHVVVQINPENTTGALAEFHFGRTVRWLTDSTYKTLAEGCE